MADKKTMGYYNANATAYGGVAPDPNGHFVGYRNKFIDKLVPGGRVLDLGCGGGHASLAFIEAGFDVVALDGSAELARVASKRTKLDVIVKDFSKLDFQSEFDGVWAAASLTHVALDNLEDVLSRVHTSLRDGGLFFASFKCAQEDWRDSEGRFYSAIGPDALSQFADIAGLEVDAVDLVQGHGRLKDPTTWAWLSAARTKIG